MMTLLDLHRRATVKGRIGYTARMERWKALRAAFAPIAARLPFKWHAELMDNPTQNHTGTTNGAVHIVLDEEFAEGRLVRIAGRALCGKDTPNLWCPCESDHVSCKRCLELAQRIAEARS